MPRAHNISQQNGEPSTQLDGGSIASAWLSEEVGDGGKLEWQTARSSRPFTDVKLFPSGPAILVSEGFGQPLGVTSRMDDRAFQIREDLYKPTQFLDRHHFDAHVPHAALVEGLVSLHERAPQGDSYPGTTLALTAAHLPRRATRSASTTLLAQCGGRAGKELVVSSFASAERPRPGLPAALAKTAATHDIKMKLPAAILDIQSITRSSGAAFAVRTHAAISLLQIERPVADKAQSESTEPVYLAPVAFGSEHLGGHAPADCALSPFASSKRAKQALIVDETGGLWEVGTTAETARTARGAWKSPYAGIDQLRQGAPPGERTPFARVAYGMTDRQAIVALEDAVRFFDLQDPANDRTVFRLHDPKTRILGLCKPSYNACGTPIRVVITSDEVVWLDISSVAAGSEPVLRYKHRRDNDITLSISTVFVGGLHHAFLWSRQVSHITVLCYTETLPVQLLCEPYVLNAARPMFQRAGMALLDVPASRQRGPGRHTSVTMLEKSSDGEVFQHELVASLAEPAAGHMTETARERLAMRPSSDYEQPSAIELRKHRVADFRKIYRGIFSNESSLSNRLNFSSALKVEDLPANEDAHQCLPLELAVTLGASDEENARPPGINPFSSVQALDRASLALEQLEAQYANLQIHREATYEHTFTDACMGVNLTQAPLHSARALQSTYAIAQRPGEPHEGQKLQEAHDFACEQLAVDLALSRQVLSAHPIQAPYPGEVDASMMHFNSIADIPSIDFGYFNPVLKRPKPGQTALDTPAARALLSEWKLGADPEVRPAYSNPYDGRQQQERIANKQYAAYRSRVAEGQQISASQPAYQPHRDAIKGKQRDAADGKMVSAQKRVVHYEGHESQDCLRSVDEERDEEPVLEIGQAAQPGRNGRGEHNTHTHASLESQTQSQSQSPSQTQTQTQTRPAMPYSQVVPGAFGGRPVKRKRVGGF